MLPPLLPSTSNKVWVIKNRTLYLLDTIIKCPIFYYPDLTSKICIGPMYIFWLTLYELIKIQNWVCYQLTRTMKCNESSSVGTNKISTKIFKPCFFTAESRLFWPLFYLHRYLCMLKSWFVKKRPISQRFHTYLPIA